MSTPLISVVIPTYDRSASLRRAIASVFCQTIDDYELIVVDDGSTDDTLQVLADIHDSRLRVIRHPKNLGASTARNSGVNASHGTYVAFLDSDDEWLPDKLAKQTALMAGQPPEVAACCTRHFVTKWSNGASWQRILPTENDWQRYLITHGCNLSPGSTLMVRRDVFADIGSYDTELCRYEDWDWLLRYLERYRLVIAPDMLAIVNLSAPPSSECLAQSMATLIPRWQMTARQFGLTAQRRMRARFYLELAKSQFLESRKKVGLINVLRALLLWPLQRPVAGTTLLRYLYEGKPEPSISLPRKWHHRVRNRVPKGE